jgi:arylsulfatase A-like enzyme/Flp pilus assembly protein TadD
MIFATLAGVVAIAAPVAQAPAAAGARPNVLLVTVDTLRADRVGAYGYAKAATATMDRLAREGVLLEDAVVHVPQTRPSHACILTGRLPYEHGIRDNYSRPLPESLPTLATVLRRSGWDTGAFIGAYPVSRPSGLDRGWNVYGDPFADGASGPREARTERRAKEVVDAALEWLVKPRDRPFLAWVHVFDPHAPYEAPAPYGARFAKSPYDGEVAYADAEIGRILAWLEASGQRSRTLVVVTADHGEGLGDHGEDEHMFFVYDSTLKVPLVLSWPGRLPAGARVAGQFRSIDLMPTILELAGVASPPVTGVSRAAALRPGGRVRDSESYAESLYAQLHFGYAPLRALRGDGWKLIDAPKAELYRVAEDPGETRNLLDSRGPIAAAMRTKLAGYDREAGKPPELPAVDPDAAARLAALGYVGTAGPAGAPAGSRASGVDPKDRIAELQGYQRDMRLALARFQQGDYATAAQALERAGRSGPASFNVEYYLGRSLVELRRFGEAIPHLEKAAEMAPTRHTLSGLAAAPIYARLVEAYAADGQMPKALATLDKALRVAPGNAELVRARGSLLLRQGDLDGARAALEKARAADAREPRLHVELANCYRNMGDLPKAEAAAKEAVRLDPRSADAQLALGLVDGALGRDAAAARALREAVRLSPEHPDALFYLAAIELRAGRAPSALPLLEKLQKLAPEYPRGREALAMARRMTQARVPAATP